MIYLNKTCYNGLYRVNSAGLFNTPYGRYKNPAICEAEVLRAVSKYLSEKNIRILNEDFETAVVDASQGDFVYFDPPYDSPDLTNFTGYQANGFYRDEQIRLRDTMLELTERGVKCLLSNSSTDFINEIYNCPEFKTEYVQAARMINSCADGRGSVQEVLVRNW
jgi:DNA adenine methylase